MERLEGRVAELQRTAKQQTLEHVRERADLQGMVSRLAAERNSLEQQADQVSWLSKTATDLHRRLHALQRTSLCWPT